MKTFKQMKTVVGLVLMVWPLIDCTLSPSDKKMKKDKLILSTENVIDRGLVKGKIKAKDILSTHRAYCDVERELKNFTGETLAYVTPWSGHGYDVAKLFGNKFDYVSPVWLQIRMKNGGEFEIDGGNDIDKKWMYDVSNGRKLKIVPRLMFNDWSFDDFKELLESQNLKEECVKTVLKFIKSHHFDGITLELWTKVVATGVTMKMSFVEVFIQLMGNSFKKSKKILIVAVPPPFIQKDPEKPIEWGTFRLQNLNGFIDSVTAISLMMYDYSGPRYIGPVSPLLWIEHSIEYLVPNSKSPNRKKLLIELNLFGYDYGPKEGVPIPAKRYLEILDKHKPKFEYDDHYEEHVFKYKTTEGKHTVYYPTLKTLHDRIELAEEMGTGIALWEIGQGLDYFYDLL